MLKLWKMLWCSVKLLLRNVKLTPGSTRSLKTTLDQLFKQLWEAHAIDCENCENICTNFATCTTQPQSSSQTWGHISTIWSHQNSPKFIFMNFQPKNVWQYQKLWPLNQNESKILTIHHSRTFFENHQFSRNYLGNWLDFWPITFSVVFDHFRIFRR